MKILAAIGNAISKFIAFVFTLLFIVVTVLVLLLFNAERKLFDAETYKRAILEENLYERLPALAAEEMMTVGNYDPCRDNPSAVENPEECLNRDSAAAGGGEGEGGAPAFLKNVSQAQWEKILSELLPPQLVQSKVESVLDQVFAFLNSSSGELSISIPITDLKERIAGEHGVNAVMTLIESLPPCTQEQLDAVGSAAGAGEMPACRPPDDILAEIRPEIETQLKTVVADIPDEVKPDLSGLASGEGGGPFSGNGREAFQLIRQIIRFSPLISIAFLGLVTLFGVRSLKGWLRWWGWPLLLVGLIVAPAAFVAIPALEWLYAVQLAPQIPVYHSPELVRAGFNVGLNIARAVIAPIRQQALLLGLAALVMLILSFFLKGEPKPA